MIWRHGTYSLWRLWIYSSHCVPSFLPSTQVERTNSIFQGYRDHRASQAVPVNPPANARDPKDVASVPGSERSPGGGHGNPPWYSCLENPYGQNSLVGYRLLFMGFLRQEYWTGLPSPSSGGLPHKGWNWCLLDCWWILYHCATSSQLWTSTRAQKCQLESTIQKLVVQLMYFHFFLQYLLFLFHC